MKDFLLIAVFERKTYAKMLNFHYLFMMTVHKKNHIGKSEYQCAQVQTLTISSTGSNLLRNVGKNGENSIANTRVKTGFLQTYPRRKTN